MPEMEEAPRRAAASLAATSEVEERGDGSPPALASPRRRADAIAAAATVAASGPSTSPADVRIGVLRHGQAAAEEGVPAGYAGSSRVAAAANAGDEANPEEGCAAGTDGSCGADTAGVRARGVCITLRELRVSIPAPLPAEVPRWGASAKPRPWRELLQRVTGVIEPGRLTALMGSSGAGKTTLLDVISKRKTTGRITGAVLLDGREADAWDLKACTAYIQQDDALAGFFTVGETIAFAAEMKMARGTPAAARRARVEEVARAMGLTGCLHVQVGNRMVRGVSGGERKRTSVACGLLCKPRGIFMDEPTSGLDSATAGEVMACVKALQLEGATLLVTIHQPSPAVYRLFDDLILLQPGGRVAYWGRGGDAPCDYFAALGFPYQMGYNVAEYLLDTLAAPAGAARFAADYEASELAARQAARAAEGALRPNGSSSSWSALAQLAPAAAVRRELSGSPRLYQNGMVREVAVLLSYRGLNKYRSPLFLFSRVALYVALACLLASFFYSQRQDPRGLLNVASILFLSVTTPTYTASVFVADIGLEREVYTREFHDSYYRAASYVVAKVLTDVPSTLTAAFAWSGTVYWSIGMRAEADAFFFFVLCTWVNMLTAMLVGFCVAACLPGDVAPMVTLPCFATLNTLVTGFLVSISTMPIIWRWLYTISYEQWLWSALMTNQFRGAAYYAYCDGASTTAQALLNLMPSSVQAAAAPYAPLLAALSPTESDGQPAGCAPILGDDVLELVGLQSRGRWQSIGYATLTLPVLFCLFYAGVRLVRHEKR